MLDWDKEGYREGFEDGQTNERDRILALIESELNFAKTVNPQMALGMLQIKSLIQKTLQEGEKGGRCVL